MHESEGTVAGHPVVFHSSPSRDSPGIVLR